MLRRVMMASNSGGGPTDPYWENVGALLHFDGADGSTTFTDQKGNIWTPSAASVALRTSQKKFGSASAHFTGYNTDGASLAAPYAAGLDLVGGDFTVEMWARRGNSVANLRLFSTSGGTLAWNGTTGIHFLLQIGTGGALQAQIANGTAAPINVVGGFVDPSAWPHVAACVSDDTMRIYVAGAQVGSVDASAIARPSTNPTARIGKLTGDAAGNAFYGWLDDFRITKGVARYTSNFTPPAAPFPDS